ncbi:MAG TPA: hydroxyisourate hydrolase [Mycobacteriales bacterium]|nr:hydroxyisourate hydrolase [Mycobacteriales bacterium]
MSVSTHVLDATTGRPAAGVAVRLSDMEGAPLASGHTDADGRCALVPYDLEAGTYELTFDSGGYFRERTFFPSVTVAFVIRDGGAHHHVPLLLSPFSYTTYQGS